MLCSNRPLMQEPRKEYLETPEFKYWVEKQKLAKKKKKKVITKEMGRKVERYSVTATGIDPQKTSSVSRMREC